MGKYRPNFKFIQKKIGTTNSFTKSGLDYRLKGDNSRNETKGTTYSSTKFSTVLPDTVCSLKFQTQKGHYDFDKHTKRPSYIGNENGKAKQWLRDAIIESS